MYTSYLTSAGHGKDVEMQTSSTVCSNLDCHMQSMQELLLILVAHLTQEVSACLPLQLSELLVSEQCPRARLLIGCDEVAAS
jgi:hypothetical protein